MSLKKVYFLSLILFLVTPALKKIMPFALRAYKTSPKITNVLEVLVGIYYTTGDKKESFKV